MCDWWSWSVEGLVGQCPDYAGLVVDGSVATLPRMCKEHMAIALALNVQ